MAELTPWAMLRSKFVGRCARHNHRSMVAGWSTSRCINPKKIRTAEEAKDMGFTCFWSTQHEGKYKTKHHVQHCKEARLTPVLHHTRPPSRECSLTLPPLPLAKSQQQGSNNSGLHHGQHGGSALSPVVPLTRPPPALPPPDGDSKRARTQAYIMVSIAAVPPPREWPMTLSL